MKLRLQKQLSRSAEGRKVGERAYYKYVVVIPNQVIREKKLWKRKIVEVEIK